MTKKRHIECEDTLLIDEHMGALGDKKDRDHRLIQISGHEKINCGSCGKLYPKKRLDLGYEICIECASKIVKKYVGRRYDGRHDGTTEIFRTANAIESAKTQIRRENAIGFSPNVGISHPVAVQKWEK
jgi:hypothetical protein